MTLSVTLFQIPSLGDNEATLEFKICYVFMDCLNLSFFFNDANEEHIPPGIYLFTLLHE